MNSVYLHRDRDRIVRRTGQARQRGRRLQRSRRDADEPHVDQGLTSYHNMVNAMHMGQLGPMPDRLDRHPGMVFALAGSCAYCERDETAESTAALKKCSKCKLTRYVDVKDTSCLRKVC